MSTRVRAIISASIATFLFVLNLTGTIPSVISQLLRLNNLLVAEAMSAVMISLFLVIFTAWTLFFKRKDASLWTVILLPAVTIFPYTVFSDTIVDSLFGGFGQIATSLMLVITFWLFTYLLLLTANILNGAVIYNIPLGQAGKAAQFVFSLISSYLLVAFLASAGLNTLVEALALGIFIFYWSASAVWMLRVKSNHVIIAALVIALLVVLLELVLSVWPIPTVYSTVVIVIFFYVLLNVALEIRQKIGEAFWLEYTGLIIVCFALLAFLSEWGISGNLI